MTGAIMTADPADTPIPTAAALVLDDPEWPMPQHSAEPGRPPATMPRRLRVWRLTDGTLLAVITERGPGTSVTNVAEHAYAALAHRYPGRLRVVEHYPAETGVDDAEHFDEITLLPTGAPRWRRIPIARIIGWCGPTVLDDMPELPPDPDDTVRPLRPMPAAPIGPDLDPATVIHGYPTAGGALVLLESAGGDPIGPLPHHVKHSPTGFTWGYHGSGPAELARCILIAVLGAKARCATCAGSAWVVFDTAGDEHPYDPDTYAAAETQRCWTCDGGISVAPQLYQRFKESVVADWPTGAEFRITAGEVRAWLDAIDEDGPRG
jgi:hypothetical protein